MLQLKISDSDKRLLRLAQERLVSKEYRIFIIKLVLSIARGVPNRKV